MATKPDGAAGLLAGLAERLARGLLDDVEALEQLARPENDIALERRARLRGVIARTALSIRKLQDHEDRPDGPQAQDEADMDDQPDDPDTIERKYVQIRQELDRYARRHDDGGDPGHRAGPPPGRGSDELAVPGEQEAA